jgi:WD40 repeat protein
MRRLALILPLSLLLTGCGSTPPPPAKVQAVADPEAEPPLQPTARSTALTTVKPTPSTKKAPRKKKPGIFSQFPRRPIQMSVSAVAFSPDGKYMLTGYEARWKGRGDADQIFLRLWDVATGQELEGLPQNQVNVTDIVFLSDSRRAWVATADGTINLWQINTDDSKIVRKLRPFGDENQYPVFSADGGSLLISTKGHLSLHALPSGSRRWTRNCEGPSSLMLSSNGKLAFFRLIKPQIWDASLGKAVFTIKWNDKEDESWREPQDFSPDGKTVLSFRENRIVLWDVATGRDVRVFDEVRSERKNAINWISREPGLIRARFSLDGKTILTGDSHACIRRWDVATGKELHVLAVPESEYRGLESYSGLFFFSADGKFALWTRFEDLYAPHANGHVSNRTQLLLCDTLNFKLLGPALRRDLPTPNEAGIRRK